MTLDFQNMPITLAQGVDTKTDPKQVAGKLLTLENGVFRTARSIRKRYGYTAPSTSILGGGTVGAGVKVASSNNELLLGDGSSLYSYDSVDDKWVTKRGKFVPCSVTETAIWAAQFDNFYQGDTAIIGNVQCYVWRSGQSNYAYVATKDRTNGCFIAPPQTISAHADCYVRVVSNGTYFYIIVASSDSGDIYSYKMLPSATSVSNVVQITATEYGYFDACLINGRIYIGWSEQSGGTRHAKLAYLNTSNDTVTSVASITMGATTATALAVCGDSSNRVFFAYNPDPQTLKYTVYDSAGAQVLAATTVATYGSPAIASSVSLGYNGTSIYYAITHSPSSGTFNTTTYQALIASINYGTLTSGGTVTSVGDIYGVWGQGKITGYSGSSNLYILGYFYSHPYLYTDQQSTYFLYQINGATATIVAKIASQNAGDIHPHYTPMPSAMAMTSATAMSVMFCQASSAITQVLGGVGTALIVYGSANVADITIGTQPLSQTYRGSVKFSGGIVNDYDSAAVYENNFHQYPAITSNTTSGTGGHLSAGTYNWVFTYEWTDNFGNVHRSAPSFAWTRTVSGSTSKAVITVRNLNITAKNVGTNPIYIKMWRTLANGSVYHYVTEQINDYTSITDVTFTDDTYSDTDISSNTQLYTTTGEVPNTAPPAFSAMACYRTRLVGVSPDNPTGIWYSKEETTGYGAEFSADFVQQITSKGGAITALAEMDDKLVIFKAGSIYYMTGTGPAPNGTSNDFSPEQIITSPVGCGNPYSVVLTPDGLMFQASNGAGIWLLDRSLSVTYIGAEVETYNGQTVTGAVMTPKQNIIRFTLDNGIALVWDYVFKQWSVFTNTSAVSACDYGGVLAYLTSGGQVYKESTSAFSDAGTAYNLKLVTGWLQTAGVQGFQRIREVEILGDWKSAHTLSVQVGYDFSSSYLQTESISATSSVALYQWRVLLQQQKCEAFRLLIQDNYSVTPGECYSLTGLNAVIGVKRGLNRLPQSATFT